jgi:hypothetical protein
MRKMKNPASGEGDGVKLCCGGYNVGFGSGPEKNRRQFFGILPTLCSTACLVFTPSRSFRQGVKMEYLATMGLG